MDNHFQKAVALSKAIDEMRVEIWEAEKRGDPQEKLDQMCACLRSVEEHSVEFMEECLESLAA